MIQTVEWHSSIHSQWHWMFRDSHFPGIPHLQCTRPHSVLGMLLSCSGRRSNPALPARSSTSHRSSSVSTEQQTRQILSSLKSFLIHNFVFKDSHDFVSTCFSCEILFPPLKNRSLSEQPFLAHFSPCWYPNETALVVHVCLTHVLLMNSFPFNATSLWRFQFHVFDETVLRPLLPSSFMSHAQICFILTAMDAGFIAFQECHASSCLSTMPEMTIARHHDTWHSYHSFVGQYRLQRMLTPNTNRHLNMHTRLSSHSLLSNPFQSCHIVIASVLSSKLASSVFQKHSEHLLHFQICGRLVLPFDASLLSALTAS